MKYTRHDVIGQKEEFEGNSLEIISLIKLLEMNNNGELSLAIMEDGLYLYELFDEFDDFDGIDDIDDLF